MPPPTGPTASSAADPATAASGGPPPFDASALPADGGNPPSSANPSDGNVGSAMLGVVWSIAGFGVFLVAAVIGLVLSLLFVDVDLATLSDTSDMPTGALAMSLLFQQIGQAGWPLLVGKWFPGVEWSDLRIGFKPIDLGIGLGTAFIALFTASVFGFAAAKLVGLEDQSAADNSAFLGEAKGSPWLFLIVFCVVVGAPVAEELFFRGLVLSAFEKLGAAIARGASMTAQAVSRMGTVVGVIASTIIFTLPHFIGGTFQETIVLFSSIGAVGVVLALAAIYTNRLGASMVAHMIFNAIGASAALGLFDDILPT